METFLLILLIVVFCSVIIAIDFYIIDKFMDSILEAENSPV